MSFTVAILIPDKSHIHRGTVTIGHLVHQLFSNVVGSY